MTYEKPTLHTFAAASNAIEGNVKGELSQDNVTGQDTATPAAYEADE